MSDVLNSDAAIPADRVQHEVTIDCFRQAMRELAGGVAVVTVGQDSERTGFTATSVESLSVEPPRVLLCVNQNSSSWKRLQSHPGFGVNILCAEHQWLADQFAGRAGLRGEERYRGASWTRLSDDGAAILKDALVGADCIVEEILLRHGHAIIIGRVRAVLFRADGLPLLYWQGAYRQIATHSQITQSEKELS